MATNLTDSLRRRHDELRPSVERIAQAAAEVSSLSRDARRSVVIEILAFLHGELQLHNEAEEGWLYPEIALQLRHPGSMAGMQFDYKLLDERTADLEAADFDDVSALQATLYAVHTLVDAHLRKEEEVYLPFLEYESEAQAVVEIEESMARHERGEPEPMRKADIDLDVTIFPSSGLPVEKLSYLLRYAVQAPSSHNSQPWRFRVTGDSAELLADRSRALPVVDPDDRELVMSCGAALFTLRTAIRHHGYEDDVEPFPDDADPDLLARIRLGEPRTPTRAEKLLFWAISARHTNRNAFEARPVPEQLLAELRQAAETEGARLRVLEQEEQRLQLADLVVEGDKRQFADPRFRRELAAWMHASRRDLGDGMPADALDIPAPIALVAPLVIRTFDVGNSAAAHDRKIADSSPALVVLGTPDDTPQDWLAAGQAVTRVLLRATQDEVSASFLNQPIEVAELRAAVAGLAEVGVPQLVLRLGYGPAVKPTPRRPLGDVVQLDAPTAAGEKHG
jgi:iron-sulfur cluster repair protein YtfE (RIC family)